MRMNLCIAAVAVLGVGGSAWADFSDDPDNPTMIDIHPGLTLVSVALEGSNQADWVRFTVEDGEAVTSLFNFESFFYHSDQVTMRLDQYVEITPGFEIPILLGEFQLDQFTGPTDDLLWQLSPTGDLLPGDYRLGWTQSTTEYSDMRFVFRTVPAPGAAMMVSAGLIAATGHRRR